MPKLIDLTGNRFGRLIVMHRIKSKKPYTQWMCQCDCGNTHIVAFQKLIEKQTSSCGCYKKDVAKARMTTHGKTHTTEYNIWASIVQRCENPKSYAYKNYGKRGITICKEWRFSFNNFLNDMGPRPKGMQIDRINNNKGYSKENCRWVTPKENTSNTRNTKKWIVHGEIFLSAKEAAQKYNVSWSTIVNWCKGHIYKSGFARPPKEGCSYELLYN